MRNLLLLVSVLLSALLAAHPAAAAESVRIAVLTSQDTTPYQEVLSGFQQHLDQRGLQVVYDISSLQGNMAKAETALARLKHDGAELLFTLGTLATQAAVRENVDTPLLASLILNTEDLKQAKNATAVTLEFPVDLQLQWLRRILPQQQAVGVLFNPRDNADTIRTAQRVAPSVGLTLLAREVNFPKELQDALESIARQADVLWGITDPTVLAPQTAEPLLLFSFRNRIPFIGLSTSWVKAGALYALDRDYQDVGIQCAELALKIQHGERAGHLPPQTPRKVLYSLNLKTAAHMKLNIPQGLIDGAQQLFQ
jgi:putative ABC transport system substrate-binding protein